MIRRIKDRVNQKSFYERRIGGFSIFHFAKVYNKYCFYVSRTTLLSIPIGTFRFLVVGLPLRDRRKFFVLNFALLYLFR